MSRFSRVTGAKLGVALVGLLVGAAALVGLAGPAASDGTDGSDGMQAPAGMSWSMDGTSFAQTLPEPLLPANVWLSPGSVERAGLWVRNDSNEPRDVIVKLEVASTAYRQASLLTQKALGVSARLGDADWRTRRVGTEPHTLVVGTLEPGTAESLDIRVAMSPETQGRVSGADLTLALALEDAPVRGWADRLLPAESPVTSIFVPLGVLLVAGGALVANRREVRAPETPFGEPRRRAATAVTVDEYDAYFEDARL